MTTIVAAVLGPNPGALEKSRHTPLWEVAQRRGIVYGGSISTWMYQGNPGDPAYAHLFRREVSVQPRPKPSSHTRPGAPIQSIPLPLGRTASPAGRARSTRT